MSALQVNKTYSDPIPPTVEQFNDAFDSIESFFNVTGLGADNIADDSLNTNEFSSSSATESKLGGLSVSTTKIINGAVTAAKLVNDISQQVEPIGVIGEFGTDTTPAGWIPCDGLAVSRTTYAALFAVVGVRFGSGDGTTTFNAPDLSGRFIRGTDGTAGRDPNSATRTAMNTGGAVGNNTGSVELDDTKFTSVFVTGQDTPLFFTPPFNTGYPGYTSILNFGDTFQDTTLGGGSVIYAAGLFSSDGTSTGLDTHPENASIAYFIKT